MGEADRNMLSIAVVDDDPQESDRICSYIKRYEAEKKISFSVRVYQDGMDITLLNEFPDILFLDVEMKNLDGLSAAREIRKRDEQCVIIFVTKVAQYAVDGYGVNALDFIVKPAKYESFSFKLDRAVSTAQKNADNTVTVTVSYGKQKLKISEILYVEVANHKLIYHTEQGMIEVWDSLKNVREMLESHGFAICNVCYLVNLRRVSSFVNDYVIVGKETLKVSRQKKKDFLNALARYLC